MNSLNIKCQISLSKKIRKALLNDSDASITLILNSIKDGKGEGNMIINGDIDENEAVKLLDSETNIQLTPYSIDENLPSDYVVSNIFTSNAQPDITDNRVIKRIAVTKAPDDNAKKHAIKSRHVIIEEAAESIDPILKNPEFTEYVASLEDFDKAIAKTRHKKSSVNLDAISDPRKKAIAMEQMNMEEAMDIPAYIVNERFVSIAVNDIGIALPRNSPVSLNKFSVHTLNRSNDLKDLLNRGLIKFIDPNTIQEYTDKQEESTDMGLGLYDRNTGKTAQHSDSIIGDKDNKNPTVKKASKVNQPQKRNTVLIDGEDEDEDDETVFDVLEDLNSPSEQEALAGLMSLTPGNPISNNNNRRKVFSNR